MSEASGGGGEESEHRYRSLRPASFRNRGRASLPAPCLPAGLPGDGGGRRVPTRYPPVLHQQTTILPDLTHNRTQTAHARTHTQRDILVVVVGFFFFLSFFVFFFLFTLQKERASSVELMKELTNITKILQLVKISSTLSFYEQGGDPGCRGRRESERCQLGLRNSLIFFFPFPTKAE